MQADCDWDGVMNRTDFLGVGQEILKNSCDQMDDVKAAFRVFDSNDNGSISKEELREAMVNLGQRCTEEYVVLIVIYPSMTHFLGLLWFKPNFTEPIREVVNNKKNVFFTVRLTMRGGGVSPSALTVRKCENFGPIYPIIKW